MYSGTYGYDFTPLRTNPTYSAVTNWLRLIFLGALPLSIIIYFNVKVYQDVKERSSRNAKRKCEKILRNVKVSAYILLCNIIYIKKVEEILPFFQNDNKAKEVEIEGTPIQNEAVEVENKDLEIQMR